MDDDLVQLQELARELAAAAPLEVFPVEAMPVPAAIGWMTRLLLLSGRHAPLLAFLGALFENTALLGFLLPGGTAVVLAGAGARTAGVPLALVVALAAAGMTAGAGVDYALGRAGVARLLRHPRAGRLGRRLADQLEQAAPLLRRHGWWMMLVAHAFGHGRSSLAVAAGASRLPLKRFFAIEVPAAILWGGLYAGGGYYLAAEWGRVELALRRAGWVGAALLIVSALIWWLQRGDFIVVACLNARLSSVSGSLPGAPECRCAPSASGRTRACCRPVAARSRATGCMTWRTWPAWSWCAPFAVRRR